VKHDAELYQHTIIEDRKALGNISMSISHLNHSNKVHITPGDHFFDELDQFFLVLFLALQPGRVEVQTKRRPVAVEVPVEVVPEQPSELLTGLNVGARVDHVATRQGFIESGIVSAIQLVHHHFPDRMRSGRAVTTVTVASVRHPEVQGIRPDRYSSQGRRDGSIVDEELIGHHLELFVTADPEIRSAHADDGTVSDVGEALDDQPSAGHFRQPIVVSALTPILRIFLVGQREHRDLVTASMQILDGRVVGVLMRDEESTTDLTTVRILSLSVEDLFVQVDVVDVHGAVEGDRDHLRHLLGIDIARDASAISRAVAIGQHTLRGIAIRCTVGIGFHGCNAIKNAAMYGGFSMKSWIGDIIVR